MHIDFEKKFSNYPPSKERVELVFRECHNHLPQIYVEFLSCVNGGVPYQKFGRMMGSIFVVDAFLPLLNEDEYKTSIYGNYDLIWTFHQVFDRLDENSLPFATLFGGDLLCFQIESEKKPRIVRWHHETSLELSPRFSNIADSFNEFISMLKRT